MSKAVIHMELPPEVQRAVEESRQIPIGLGLATFLVCMAAGTVCLWNPEGLWDIQHAFTVTNGEPTDFYLLCTRILGGVLIAAGIVCLCLTIFSHM